jgi:diadenosine tetraphosphate (Ap4A) HIT family hydrolase
VNGFQCQECGFSLWVPVTDLKNSALGLYDDARFPGRCILALRRHYEALEDVPPSLAGVFVAEATSAAVAIRRATSSPRVNYAILGNAEAHVHFHLIPRYPSQEEKPSNSPWDDPRPKRKLDPIHREQLVERIATELLDSQVKYD